MDTGGCYGNTRRKLSICFDWETVTSSALPVRPLFVHTRISQTRSRRRNASGLYYDWLKSSLRPFLKNKFITLQWFPIFSWLYFNFVCSQFVFHFFNFRTTILAAAVLELQQRTRRYCGATHAKHPFTPSVLASLKRPKSTSVTCVRRMRFVLLYSYLAG